MFRIDYLDSLTKKRLKLIYLLPAFLVELPFMVFWYGARDTFKELPSALKEVVAIIKGERFPK